MQTQALAAQIANFLTETFVAILGVASDAMPGMKGVDTDLVSPAGNRLGFDQGGKVAEAAQDLEHRHGLLALLLVDLDHALAGTQIALAQRRTDLLDRARPVTADQRHVALVD